MHLLVLLLLVLVGIAAPNALVYAGEPLVFAVPSSDLRERQAIDFLHTSGNILENSALTLARVDLNDDGVFEYILNQSVQGCGAAADCAFHIVAIHNNTPSLLGFIKARKIGMSDQKVYGVKKIVVYNDQANDFAFRLFYWDPQTSAYVLE